MKVKVKVRFFSLGGRRSYLLQSWNTVSGRPSTSDLQWTSSHTHGFSEPEMTEQNPGQITERR